MKKKNETEQLIQMMQKYMEERNANPQSVYSIIQLKNIRRTIIEKTDFFIKMINKYGNSIDISKKAVLLATVAHCYNDEGKYLLIKNNFITGGWNFDKIQNCDNRYLKKVIKKSLTYFEKAVDLYKRIENDNQYKFLSNNLKLEYRNSIKISYGDIARIYYSLNDEEKFLIYANYAIEYDSLNLLSLVIKYYCDNDDFENTLKFYKKSTEIEIPYDIVNLPNTFTNESSKYNCGIWFINYIMSLKKYDMAKEVILETKNSIKNTKTIPLDYCLSALSDREKICDDYLSNKDSKSTNCNKELLKKYFEDKIIKKMDDNIKTYVNTSIEIYDYLNSLNYELDYSSSLISIMKALEALLYEIIANNYLKYLQSLKEIDFDKIDKSIRIKTANGYQLRDTINRIEYGSVISIIGKRNPNNFNEWIIYNDFYNFFINNMPGVNNPQKVISTFLNKLDDLREKRNNVAHKEPVSQQDAKYCISELVEAHINFISYVYNNFEFCFKDINI